MKDLSKYIEENWLNSFKLIDFNTEEETSKNRRKKVDLGDLSHER